MKTFAGLLLLLLGCVACGTDEAPRAVLDVLQVEGMTEVEITGVAVFSCSDDDSMVTSRTFRARTREGTLVEGSVCCGLILKGCTVRW